MLGLAPLLLRQIKHCITWKRVGKCGRHLVNNVTKLFKAAAHLQSIMSTVIAS